MTSARRASGARGSSGKTTAGETTPARGTARGQPQHVLSMQRPFKGQAACGVTADVLHAQPLTSRQGVRAPCARAGKAARVQRLRSQGVGRQVPPRLGARRRCERLRARALPHRDCGAVLGLQLVPRVRAAAERRAQGAVHRVLVESGAARRVLQVRGPLGARLAGCCLLFTASLVFLWSPRADI